MFVARDKDGRLRFHECRPERMGDRWNYNGNDLQVWNDKALIEQFKDLKWEDDPVEVEIVRKDMIIRQRALKGRDYWVIQVDSYGFQLKRYTDQYGPEDDQYWESHNYFHTEEEAQAMLSEFRALLNGTAEAIRFPSRDEMQNHRPEGIDFENMSQAGCFLSGFKYCYDWIESRKMGEKTKNNHESLGDHLRNLLGPYQSLIDVVKLYKNGAMNISTLCRLTENIQEGIERIVQFSKNDALEAIGWEKDDEKV